LLRHAKPLSASAEPIVLAGDLNVVPTDVDIYNPGWWRFDAVMQPEARTAYQRLTAQGWLDAARHLHPRERMYTFWTTEHAFRQNKDMRLDFVLINAPLRERLLRAGVDAEYRGPVKPSDHAPMWNELAAWGPETAEVNPREKVGGELRARRPRNDGDQFRQCGTVDCGGRLPFGGGTPASRPACTKRACWSSASSQSIRRSFTGPSIARMTAL